MLDMILDRDRIDNSRCVMFGDKMETDILMAKRAQISKVLMLTGVETRESAKGYTFEPDYIFETMNDLLVTQPN
jgi:ribonucleotide monophosphatase NagD (HAD superfamily)